MKAMLKSELAMAAGVSRRTFTRWLSSNRDTLAKAGITPDMRLIPPKGVELICDLYGIDL